MELNGDATRLPPGRLAPALQERIARRRAEVEGRDARLGAQRVHVCSYMENLGWPPLT